MRSFITISSAQWRNTLNGQEKTKKLEMLPWQALFDLAISKEIDESE